MIKSTLAYKEKEISKLYYSIGEVAKMFDVNTSQIRFWEKEFDVLKPHKNKKGNRQFTAKDVENLKRIYHLVKERGFKLEGAKAELKRKKTSTQTLNTKQEVIQKLENLKTKLLSLSKF